LINATEPFLGAQQNRPTLQIKTMRIILFYFVLFIGTAATVQGQEIHFVNYSLGEFEGAEKLSPEMSQGANGLICDYFSVEYGSNGVRYFKFTNTGDAALIIHDASSDSRNLSITWPEEPIKPGASNYVVVTYDTEELGVFTNYIKVLTNSNQPPVHLKVTGVVNPKPVSRGRNRGAAY
jgi:hypothetical protein